MAGLVLLTDIFVLTPGLNGSFIRVVLGIPMVLFLPGYTLVAALFPGKEDLDWIERVVLSLGLSIAVVPMMGLWLNYTAWGIRLMPIIVSLSVFTLLMCGVAYYRRRNLPGEEVLVLSFRAVALDLKDEILKKPETTVEKILMVLMVFSILASLGTLTYAAVVPKEYEHFTEFYILGPEGMASNYPTEYVLGEDGTVIVGIVNHEYRTVNYAMDTRLDNRSLDLPENMKYISLAHNESWEETLEITPPFEGTDMKLEFLLFNDTEKEVPYRELRLWINVSEKAEEA
ncbi:DUF1616 domain-containing protein [Methanosarcina sp. Mfa9]|uniref:DUF1616 domain-containing protein n=1 Tax=Methanosarcina sp. Mfa9 TaxID=3439063 RepID=UPI003F84F9FD